MSNSNPIGPFEDPESFRLKVRMAALQVEGLKDAELRMALAYEVEPSSGVPAAEAELEFHAVDDPDKSVRVFDVAVRRRGKKSRKASDSSTLLKALVLIGAIVLCALVVDAVFVMTSISRLRASTESRQPMQNEINAVNRKTAELRREAGNIRAFREKAVSAQDSLDVRRGEMGGLLKTLALACSDRAIVKSIVTEKGVMNVKATAVSTTVAADMMSALSADCAKIGRKVSPGTIVVNPNGHTVDFEFGLTHD